jgi:hypothetical protein
MELGFGYKGFNFIFSILHCFHSCCFKLWHVCQYILNTCAKPKVSLGQASLLGAPAKLRKETIQLLEAILLL